MKYLLLPIIALSSFSFGQITLTDQHFAGPNETYIFSTLLTADERLMQMNRFFVVGIALDDPDAVAVWLIDNEDRFDYDPEAYV